MLHSINGSRALRVVEILPVMACLGMVQPARAGDDPPTIIVDIAGIRTQGETRPAQWGPALTGDSNFKQHNIRHEGAFGRNSQRPEPGTTTTLSHRWDASQAPKQLAPVLDDVRAGNNAYIKIDKNMGLGGHLFGKPSEKAWVRSVGTYLVSEIKKTNPNAKLILNTHSSGTIDAGSLDLSSYSEVILSSNRGSARQLKQVVNRFPNTSFTVISGERDFPHGFERGLMSVTAKNLKTVNIKNGGLTPSAVHRNVTNPSFGAVADVKTASGTTRMTGSLAQLIAGKGSVVTQPSVPVRRGFTGRIPDCWPPDDNRLKLPGPLDWRGGPGGLGGIGGFGGSPCTGSGIGGSRNFGSGAGLGRR